MNFGDIPDESFLKQFVGLGRHLYRTIKNLGYDYWQVGIDALKKSGTVYEFLRNRVGNSIDTMECIMRDEEKYKDTIDKMHCFNIYPPTICIKSDLLQGTNKLLFGESVDQSFIVMDDEAAGGEILFIQNSHSENGIPVDWWMVGPGDDLLERRHLKYGYKLREFPKKFKNNLYKMGGAAIELLKDIRNERTPQFMNSPYFVIMIYMSGTISAIFEIPSYEGVASVWDFINAKKFYKTQNDWGAYVPLPSLLKTFFSLDRSTFTLKMTSLTSRNQLICQGLEDGIYNWASEELPEFLNTNFIEHWKEVGIPLPAHSMNVDIKSLQKKQYDPEQPFHFKYPNMETFFTHEDLGLEFEEARSGVYLDVDHHAPIDTKVNRSHVISHGLGEKTCVLKK